MQTTKRWESSIGRSGPIISQWPVPTIREHNRQPSQLSACSAFMPLQSVSHLCPIRTACGAYPVIIVAGRSSGRHTPASEHRLVRWSRHEPTTSLGQRGGRSLVGIVPDTVRGSEKHEIPISFRVTHQSITPDIPEE